MMKIPIVALIPLSIIFVLDLIARFSCPIWFDYDRSRQGDNSFSQPTLRKSAPDGTFNGFDLYRVNHPPESTVHCVGENFLNDRGWLFRSCEYTTFCFNTEERQYYIFQEEEPLDLPSGVWSSTELKRNQQVVLAGSQPKTWFPRVADKRYDVKTKIGAFRPKVVYGKEKRPKFYYRLNATVVPFYRHPKSFQNPGHLIWDDLLAIYSVLDIFGRADDSIMLSQMKRQETKDFKKVPEPEFDLLDKFIDIFGPHEYSLKTTTLFDLEIFNRPSKEKKDNDPVFVCADSAVMGIGTLSDHGEMHWHGQSDLDYETPYNLGRGGVLRRYRDFMLKNLGMTSVMKKKPYEIIVSMSSSMKEDRANIGFELQIKYLEAALAGRAIVKVCNMATMSLKEQVGTASTAAIYISVVGGGSATAYFLPKGASLFLYYSWGAFLDWDIWNNFPDLKVNWMPIKKMNFEDNVVALVNMVKNELDRLDKQQLS